MQFFTTKKTDLTGVYFQVGAHPNQFQPFSTPKKPKRKSNYFKIFPEFSSKYLEQVTEFSQDRPMTLKSGSTLKRSQWKKEIEGEQETEIEGEQETERKGEKTKKGLAEALKKFCQVKQTWTPLQINKTLCCKGRKKNCIGFCQYDSEENSLLSQKPNHQSILTCHSAQYLQIPAFPPLPFFGKVPQLICFTQPPAYFWASQDLHHQFSSSSTQPQH